MPRNPFCSSSSTISKISLRPVDMSTKPALNEDILQEILNPLAADPAICHDLVMLHIAQRRRLFRRLCARAPRHLPPGGWLAVGKRRAVLKEAAGRRPARATCIMLPRTRICAALVS
jgi:hypothetical protein